MTIPAQDIMVEIAMATVLIQSRTLSPLATLPCLLKFIQNCHKVESSTTAGNTRLMTLLGMKMIRK